MNAKRQIPYIWLGPIITLGIMLVLYAIGGIYPFGTLSNAWTDGFAQYIPFLSELKIKIAEGGSLFFSWNIGGGGNFWSTIGYYLASPLNIIALLFPVEEMQNAFSLITLIKPFFMALTFSIFLKNTYKKNDLSVVIFSILWAMSGFMIGGIFLTSWYDAVIWFPLVIMGLNKMMKGESAWQYSLFLGLSIISNFYMGWIICIFCVIYFVYSFISDDEVFYEGTVTEAQQETDEDEKSVNIFAVFQNSYLLKSIFKFGLSSLLAGAVSAIFTLPIFNSLQSTGKGTISHDALTTDFNGVLGLLASHIFPFKNTYDSFMSNEFVFAFVGIMTIILTFAYFFTKGISIRKKIGNGLLIVIMWVSMLVSAIYHMWHGFGEPMGFMYRFAFIYSFVLIKIAYEAFCEIKNIKWYGFLAGIVVAGVCTAGIYFNELFNALFFSTKLILTIIAFIVVFAIILVALSKKEKLKNALTVILLICVVIESVVLNWNNINTIDVTDELSQKTVVSELTADLDENERLYFESDANNYKDMVQYNAIFGYKGYEVYSSLADGKFSTVSVDLGSYGNRLNSQKGASEQTPIFNMLFPTKYYIDGTGNLSESSYRTKIAEKDGYTLYENNYTMPFMYTISANIVEWDPFAYFIVIDNLNSATQYVTGTDENVAVYNTPDNFKFENCENISVLDRVDIENSNLPAEYFELREKRMAGYSYKVTDMTKPAYITFDSVAETDGMMYLYVDTYELVDMTVTLNGKTNEYYLFGDDDNCIYELGEVKKGDVATITIGGYREMDFGNDNVYAHQNNSFTTTSFTVDMEKFENAYNKLDAMSDTELLEFEDTYVKAKVTSYTDGALYIPTTYDEGWTILIDGVEAEIYEHESHILMTAITEGEHIVEMKYTPVGFTAGAVITGVSVAILVAWAVIATKRSKKEELCATIEQTSVNEE